MEYLDRECGDDAELRQFVERLLENHADDGDSFLQPPEPETTVQVSSTASNLLGSRIGSYEIKSKLGEGGMGTVYEGWDSLLRRPVAIKFVSGAFAQSEQARQRFLREARAASNLTHGGIATVYNAGECDGQAYIVFRLIDGQTVAERIQQSPLDLNDALRLTREAADALGHAHEHGVLHRDVTSRNIMIDGDGHAVIVDFGLALPEMDSRITQPGATFGTLAYMAPEVVQGKPHDRRSDLYGLGVVLYEMLTGELPFQADRAESLLYAIAQDSVQCPSERRPELGEDIDRVLLKLLARDPADRYQSGAALIEDLQRLEQGLRPEAKIPSRNRRRMWIAGIATTLSIVVGGYFLREPKTPSNGVEDPIRLAVLPLQNNSLEPDESNYIATGLSEALATKLGRFESLRITPWITSQNFAPTGMVSLSDIAAELGVERLLVGTFRQEGADLQIRLSYVDGESGMQDWAEEFVGSDQQLLDLSERIASTVATQIRGPLGDEESALLAIRPTENEEAYRYYLTGAAYLQEENQVAADFALSFFEKALELDPELAEAHVGVGAVLTSRFHFVWGGELRDLDLAEQSFREALRLDPQLWSARRGLVRIAWHRGQSEAGLSIGSDAARMAPGDPEALLLQGEALTLCGLSSDAIPILERLTQIDPANRAGHWWLVLANTYAGRRDESIAAAERFLRRFGEDPEIYYDIGLTHAISGDLESARLALRRAMALYGVDPSPYAYTVYGIVEEALENQAAARTIWQRGLDDFQRNATSGNTSSLSYIYAEALRLLLGESTWGAEPPTDELPVGYLLPIYAVALAYRGEFETALELLELTLSQEFLWTGLNTWIELPGLREFRELQEYREYKRKEAELEARLRARYAPDLGES